MKKERADKLLVEQGYAETIEKAQAYIMTGKVFTSKEIRVDKAGDYFPVNTDLYVKGIHKKYVSRGGYKLEKALEIFDFTVKNKIVLDIGSSTGGFTDAALQYGAKLSYALDVGTNQLDWKLRNNPKVIVMEQTNFRNSTANDFIYGKPSVATIDVSFISLKKILPVLSKILERNGHVIALVKPQFEANREKVGDKGIVTDRDVHKEVLENIIQFATHEGYDVMDLTVSPISGGKGNKEFLMHLILSKETIGEISESVNIEATVKSAQSVK
ncbi:TlyA family RNA methyltransferase [Lacticigenium naphthae]|uniref:TlyA family RNA methyltransferase n=1 Tax=Lacticigenium naphthae TaxID=515351 RepID=UPI00042592E5|nr:TlyA family RNA methyltransferase [Lacticigenium naphthae]